MTGPADDGTGYDTFDSQRFAEFHRLVVRDDHLLEGPPGARAMPFLYKTLGEALVSYHLTLDVFCADFGGRGKYFLPQCRSHNGLNPQGSYPLHPRWREHSGRM